MTGPAAGRYRIPWARPDLSGHEREFAADAVSSSWISGGPYLDRFEGHFRDAFGVPAALAVANGTVALQLVLRGLGIGPGNEVIIPDFAFAAAAAQVHWCGATPVPADVLADTWCLDPEAVRAGITSRTRAVIAVHTYGNVCDLGSLRSLCTRAGLSLIEDAAEALYSTYAGRPAGCHGDAGTFSFHATKTITTGEGGLVVCHDARVAERMVLLRSHGMSSRGAYWHDCVGGNFRMTNLQAALGMAQLERLDAILEARRAVFRTYRVLLAGRDDLALQAHAAEVAPVVWTLGLRLLGPDPRARRLALMRRFEERGIEVRPGFVCASGMPAFRAVSAIRTETPRSRELSESVLALPLYPGLSEADVTDIVAVLDRG